MIPSSDRRSDFLCTVCGGTVVARSVPRGDGAAVLFCAACGMGVVEQRPADTAAFYTDDYYHRAEDSSHGYSDYEFTAEHGLLWVKLLIEALCPDGGAVLDIGCATGFLLRRLDGPWIRYGIEANTAAAAAAEAVGIEIVGNDVLRPDLASAFRGRFDVIASIATFEHVLDIKAAIAASLDMLAPTGVLIFEVPVISDHRDNADWFNGSYEHIFYPTESGLAALFDGFPGVFFHGFETAIVGYSSTCIGVATKDEARFAEICEMLESMRLEDPTSLTDDRARLNLAFNVVHEFRPSLARIIRLPVLLQRNYSPALGKRLMQLWYTDVYRAGQALMELASQIPPEPEIPPTPPPVEEAPPEPPPPEPLPPEPPPPEPPPSLYRRIDYGCRRAVKALVMLLPQPISAILIRKLSRQTADIAARPSPDAGVS